MRGSKKSNILTVMFLLGWNHHHQKNPPQQAILEIQCHLLLGLRGAPWPSAYPQWLLPPPVGAMKQFPMSVKSRCFKGLLHPKVSCRIGWFFMVWWLMVGVSNFRSYLLNFAHRSIMVMHIIFVIFNFHLLDLTLDQLQTERIKCLAVSIYNK